MKKLFSSLILVLFLFVGFIGNVNASYSEDDAISRVQATEEKALEMIDILTDWSKSYSDSVSSLANKTFLNQLSDLDYAKNIDLVVAELKKNGHTAAANSLMNKKATLVGLLDYMKESMDIIEEYLLANVDDGVPGSTDLFIQVRASLKNLKQPVKKLVDIYYNDYYNDVISKVEEYDTVGELMALYDKVLDKLADVSDIVDLFEEKLETWQGIYNDYHLEDYEDIIKDYFLSYYNRLDTDFNTLYKKIEEKLQARLDEKIDVIVQNTDLNDTDSVMQRNLDLYEIIDYIDDLKSEIEEKFTKANSYIKIPKLLTTAKKYETKVLDRFQEASDYTRTYLIDNLVVEVKNESDLPYINIDMEKGLIIYRLKDLKASSVMSRLKASYGTLGFIDDYNGNIGTLSKVQVTHSALVMKELLVVVKGDIQPSGRIDITDVVKLCNKMFGKETLSQYQLLAADMDDNSKYDITDVVKLCNLLFD